MDKIKSYLEKFVDKTGAEKDCLYYGFTICGDKMHCREGYADADGALAHLERHWWSLPTCRFTVPKRSWRKCASRSRT